MRGIYFVAAHKLILNVSKIRLRLICARASYLYHLFAKALEIRRIYRQNYTSVYSFDYEFRQRKNIAAENPQCIISDKDGRGIGQKQGLEQNLSSTDAHGRTSVERYTEYILWRTGSFALGCLLGAILGTSCFSSAAVLFFTEDNPCFKFYKRTLII